MKRYHLVSAKRYGYFTGHSGDTQMILGFHHPGLLLVSFDVEGKFFNYVEREFSQELLLEWSHPPIDSCDLDKELRPKGFEELRKFAREVRFFEKSISILPFTLLPAHAVYLDSIPQVYRGVLSSPENYSVEELEQAREWSATPEDNFVFAFSWWGEYLMDADGSINST